MQSYWHKKWEKAYVYTWPWFNKRQTHLKEENKNDFMSILSLFHSDIDLVCSVLRLYIPCNPYMFTQFHRIGLGQVWPWLVMLSAGDEASSLSKPGPQSRWRGLNFNCTFSSLVMQQMLLAAFVWKPGKRPCQWNNNSWMMFVSAPVGEEWDLKGIKTALVRFHNGR